MAKDWLGVFGEVVVRRTDVVGGEELMGLFMLV